MKTFNNFTDIKRFIEDKLNNIDSKFYKENYLEGVSKDYLELLKENGFEYGKEFLKKISYYDFSKIMEKYEINKRQDPNSLVLTRKDFDRTLKSIMQEVMTRKDRDRWPTFYYEDKNNFIKMDIMSTNLGCSIRIDHNGQRLLNQFKSEYITVEELFFPILGLHSEFFETIKEMCIKKLA